MKKKILKPVSVFMAAVCLMASAGSSGFLMASEWKTHYLKEFSEIKRTILTDESYKAVSDQDINNDGIVNVLDCMRLKKSVITGEELPKYNETENTVFEVFPGLAHVPSGSIISLRPKPDVNVKPLSLEYPGNGMVYDVIGSEGDWYKLAFEYKDPMSGSVHEAYIEKDHIFFNRDVTSWQNKYAEIIKLKKCVSGRSHFAESDKYYICDINNDDIPELFFRSRSNVSDASIGEVYSVYNGKVVSTKLAQTSPSVVYAIPDTGCAVVMDQYRGKHERILKIEKGVFTEDTAFTDYFTDEEGRYEINDKKVSEDEYMKERSKYIPNDVTVIEWIEPDEMLTVLQNMDTEKDTQETVPDISACSDYGYGRITDSVAARNIPSEDGKILGTIEKSGVVFIQGKEDNWYKILYKTDWNCLINSAYIPADNVELISYSGTANEAYTNIVNDTVQFLKSSEINDEQFLIDNLLKFSLADLNDDNINELIVMSSNMSGNGPYFSVVFSNNGSDTVTSAYFPDFVSGVARINGKNHLYLERICIVDILSMNNDKFNRTEYFQNRAYSSTQADVYYINSIPVSKERFDPAINGYREAEITKYSLAEILKELK